MNVAFKVIFVLSVFAGLVECGVVSELANDASAVGPTTRAHLRLRSPTANLSCTESTALLQKAIDAAPAGNTVVIGGGEWRTDKLVLKAGVSLVAEVPGNTTLSACGDKQSSIIEFAPGASMLLSGFVFSCGNLVAGSAVHIPRATDFMVSGNRWKDISMESQAFHALMVVSGDGTCKDNTVDQSGGDALNFNSGTYTVTGNVVHKGGDGCIAFNNNAFGIISHNRVYRCDLGVGAGPEGTASHTTEPTPIHISNNWIEACNWGINMGWFAYKNRLGPVNSRVSGNTIKDCKSFGVRFDASPDLVANGLRVNLMVTDNHIFSTGSTAFDGELGTGQAIVGAGLVGASIAGNYLSLGVGVPITVTGSDYILSGNNIVVEKGADVGISAHGTSMQIQNNQISAASTPIPSGILAGGTRLVVQHNVVKGLAEGSAGIVLEEGSEWIVVRGNTIADGAANCVTLGSEPKHAVLEGNTCW